MVVEKAKGRHAGQEWEGELNDMQLKDQDSCCPTKQLPSLTDVEEAALRALYAMLNTLVSYVKWNAYFKIDRS